MRIVGTLTGGRSLRRNRLLNGNFLERTFQSIRVIIRANLLGRLNEAFRLLRIVGFWLRL